MARHAVQPLYQGIVDDVKTRISRQDLAPGDRVLSIGEMARAYNVSAITAKRAISELQSGGWVHSIKGKGTFVAPRGTVFATVGTESDAAPSPVRKIVLLTSSADVPRAGSFMAEIWTRIESAVAEHDAEFRVQMLPLTVPENHLDLLLRPEPGEGFLILAVGSLHRVLAYLADRGRPAVIVDGVAGGCHGVATDNLDGIRQVLDHLRGLGHRRIHLSTRDPRSSNCTNENERAAAFRFLCADRGLTGTIGAAERPEQLLERLDGADAPTAFMFAQDDPALTFVEAARAAGRDVPGEISVAGFDGWSRLPATANLTTLVVDRAGIGHAAVELVTRTDLPQPAYCEWPRVPGRLRIGTTTGPAPR